MIRTANRVALYARFSSDNQRTESIDAQIRAMEAYCKQHNYVIVETYVDEAKSATTDHRPAFQQMVADSASKSFDILLVHKLDRFARNRYDSAVYKRELKKNGVVVHSVLENLDSSPESVILESVLEGMSEYYSQNLAREVMKGMRETALQAKHTGGKPPLGYDVDPITQKLVLNPHEAEIVRLIYDMYSRGEGYSAILDALHYAGYKTKNGNEFRKNSLYSILTNGKYQGVYIFNRSAAKDGQGKRNTHQDKATEDIIYIEGGCPQIVDKDTFAKVQARIRENKHKGARNNAKTTYLLTGKVWCKECGRAMTGNTRFSGRSKGAYSTYRCTTRRHSCSNKEISRSYLEHYVIFLLEDKLLNPASLRRADNQIEEMADRQVNAVLEGDTEAKARLQELTAAIENIADAIGAGLLSDALVERLTALEEEKAQLEASLEIHTPATKQVVCDPWRILSEYAAVRDAPSSPAYREFIKSYIEKIQVGRYQVAVTLKTGLDVFPELNTSYQVRRQEIYEGKGAL